MGVGPHGCGCAWVWVCMGVGVHGCGPPEPGCECLGIEILKKIVPKRKSKKSADKGGNGGTGILDCAEP